MKKTPGDPIMAVKVRLTRMGSKKHPFYRIVATNSSTRRDGRPLEFLGYYNPMSNPAKVEVDREKVQKWLDLGAEVSDTVRSLLKR
jgi:small subunit ribosomal protein S16